MSTFPPPATTTIRGTSDDDHQVSPKLPSEIICAFGLLPFLVFFFWSGSVLALIVFFNGVVYHLLLPSYFWMKLFDICCNTVMVILVNIFAWNLFVTLLTCFAILSFLINSNGGFHAIAKSLIHVFGVQVPLCAALIIAEAEKTYLYKIRI
jgi:hypothetical protein